MHVTSPLNNSPRYHAMGGMLSRMIDRAADFCKHDPSTDYRTLREDETASDDESPFTDH